MEFDVGMAEVPDTLSIASLDRAEDLEHHLDVFAGTHASLLGRLAASFPPRRASTVHGSTGRVESAKAAAQAEKTEALSADFTPVPTVMPSANNSNSTPLQNADHRVATPKISAQPNHVSAMVTTHTIAGISFAGAHGFSLAV